MAEKDNQKVIELAVANLERAHGRGCIMQLGKNIEMKIEVIATGILSFDLATGVMGFPRGRVIEIFGPEGGGKTTLALQVIAQAHATGGEAAFIDAEHALDPSYARKLGVDVDRLWCSQPDCGEQALEITEALVRTGAMDVIVVDSVAALVPRAELDGEYGDAQMGLQARLMSQAMRKLVGAVAKSKTCLIFINQIRDKIGVMFGSPETTTGGRALKFYSTMRVDVRKGATVKDGDVAIGSVNKFKIVKNKVASPFREAEIMMVYGLGFSQLHDLLKLAAERNVVEKSGSWYSFKGERLGQGQEQAITFLRENAATAQVVFNETRAKVLPASEPQK
jgi:recombination protein RecA